MNNIERLVAERLAEKFTLVELTSLLNLYKNKEYNALNVLQESVLIHKVNLSRKVNEALKDK